MYDISKEYKDYLRKFDSRVSLKNNRKFYGILVTKDNIDYYIPFTSKINKRTSSKLTVNIKDKNKIIAKLLLNNMIPVNIKDTRIVDIDKEKYHDYYNKEISYLRSNIIKQQLLKKVDYMYETMLYKNNNDYEFFKKVCCNFSLLEEKCKSYNNCFTIFMN